MVLLKFRHQGREPCLHLVDRSHIVARERQAPCRVRRRLFVREREDGGVEEDAVQSCLCVAMWGDVVALRRDSERML